MERFTIVDEDEEARLQIKIGKDDQKVIKLDGELDYYNRNKLIAIIESLFAQGSIMFILDLSGITFIDSSGLSSLVLTKRLVENKGGIMPCLFSQKVKKILTLSGLEKFFLSVDTLEEAKINIAQS